MTEPVWDLKKFGDCADLNKDTIDPVAAVNVPYIGLEHIITGGLTLSGHGFADDVISAKNRFEKGDILFGKLRPYFRKVVIAPFDGVCSTDIWVVRAKPGIDQQFLFYWMASQEFVDDATRASEGTKMPRAKWEFVSQIEKEVPPLPTQHAIARILGSLDDKIELNRQMNATLEAMARAIFQSWFVDFDPVRAKAEGRQPAGMDAETVALFACEFEEVDGREVPKGWKITNVENIAEKVGMGPFGSSIKVETFVPEGMPIISGQHLQKFMLDDTTFNFISSSHAEKLKNSLVYRGDVIFTHAGNIGQAAFIPENSQYEQYIISQRQFFLRPDQKQLSPSYLSYFFTSAEGKDLLLANTSSSGVPSIARPVTYLRSIPILVPPRCIIDAFEKIVRPIHLKYRKGIDESRTLAQIRDALLPKLMSGEIIIQTGMSND